MSVPSIEVGLLIKNVNFEEIKEAAKDKEIIYGIYYETHPWNGDYIFMSWGDLGDTMPKEPQRAKQVRKWFRKHLPKAKLMWQIIRTER